MSKNWSKDVNEFLTRALQYVPNTPEKPSLKTQVQILTALQEGVNALALGLQDDDMTRTTEGCLDLIYTSISLLLFQGLDPQTLWDIKQEANRKKLIGIFSFKTNGTVIPDNNWISPTDKLKANIENQKQNPSKNITPSFKHD